MLRPRQQDAKLKWSPDLTWGAGRVGYAYAEVVEASRVRTQGPISWPWRRRSEMSKVLSFFLFVCGIEHELFSTGLNRMRDERLSSDSNRP